MANPTRMDKVSSLIQETLSEIIIREVKDPRIEWATITVVRVSQDLRIARVYISTISGDEKLEGMLIALNRMRNFLQNKLNEKIKLKFIPVLYFYPDRNIPYFFEIMEKLEKIVPELKESKDEE
jgi:ribosome-binding factor A